FSGNYVYDEVSSANWVNISNRFTFPISSAENLVPSGKVNISDLLIPGEPLYVAFRYEGLPVPPAPRMNRQWRIEQFLLTNDYDQGATTLADQTTAGWSIVSRGGVDPGRGGTIQTTRLNFFANNVNLDVGVEEWGITQAIDLFKIEPD